MAANSLARYLTILNYRTLIVLLLSIGVPYIAYEFGIDISTVSGEVNNIKITSEQDIKQFKGIT